MAAEVVYRFDYLAPQARGRVFIHGYSTQAVAYSGYPVPIWYRGDDPKAGHFTLSHNETTLHVDGTIGRWVDVQCLNQYNALMLFVLQLIETPLPFPIPPPPGPTPWPHLAKPLPVKPADAGVHLWYDEQGRIQAVGRSLLGDRCLPVAQAGQHVLTTAPLGDLSLQHLAETHFVDRNLGKLVAREQQSSS